MTDETIIMIPRQRLRGLCVSNISRANGHKVRCSLCCSEAELETHADGCLLKPESPYMPTADEAFRFIDSNPRTAAGFLAEVFSKSREDSKCSNGRLRDIWKLAGGAVDDKKDRAWIEVHLLPGLMRLLSELPQPE